MMTLSMQWVAKPTPIEEHVGGRNWCSRPGEGRMDTPEGVFYQCARNRADAVAWSRATAMTTCAHCGKALPVDWLARHWSDQMAGRQTCVGGDPNPLMRLGWTAAQALLRAGWGTR